MKILHCPLNGPRPLSEFAYGGEVRKMPDPNTCTDAEWADYAFCESHCTAECRACPLATMCAAAQAAGTSHG